MDSATKSNATLVLDVGKTHVKVVVFSERGTAIHRVTAPSPSLKDTDYDAIDVSAIWEWFLEQAKVAAAIADIRAINISTHGACAALVGSDGEPVTPVLDYEYEGISTCDSAYDEVRPPFIETLSPSLPVGLNLGRQLFWLRERFPERIRRVRHILLYPQYFVFKLTGVAVSEATSLGCHTDLWNPREGRPSSLFDCIGLGELLPQVVDVTTSVASLLPSVAEATGLSRNCMVYPGVHDSNASLARYLAAGMGNDSTVVSTGTWTISMAMGVSTQCLDETQDMLANVSVLGDPVCCARFMGGREYEEICRRAGAELDASPSEEDIMRVVRGQGSALPNFAPGCGPFPWRSAELSCPPGGGSALATLYLALMIDYELDLLRSTGTVVFGSASTRNPVMCRLLAQLRPEQDFLMSGDEASTPLGAWCLTRWSMELPAMLREFVRAQPTDIPALDAFRQAWRAAL